MARLRVPFWLQYAAGAIAALAGLCWGIAASRVIWYAGDYMIGFHPLVLWSLPAAGVLVIAGCVAFALGSWRFGAGALLGGIGLIPAMGWMPAFYGWGPEHGVAKYAAHNAAAIVAAQLPEIPQMGEGVPYDDEKLAPLTGFRWYCTNHIAAPNGIYLAWQTNGIPHVRVQKQHGGWTGLAYTQDSEAINKLGRDSGYCYQASETPGWWHWDTSE